MRAQWRAHHESQIHGTVRGVAIAGNRVFRGFRDGTMAAYDIATGEEVWTAIVKKRTASRDDRGVTGRLERVE